MVLTGKRGGYGSMRPMLLQMKHDKEIILQLVVTDQHVSRKFGNTITEIKKDFEIAAEVDMEQDSGDSVSRAAALGRCLTGMALVMHDLKPDLIVLYGDRGEVLSSAVAATTMGIPIAHIQGGDVTGSVDEQMRHALTKLSQLHFPSNKESAERIIRMGEDAWRVNVVGDNHIDSIVSNEYLSSEDVLKRLGLDLNKKIFVVLQHSETTDPESSYSQMRETMLAINEFNVQKVIIYPCSDSGYEGIIKAIDEYAIGEGCQVKVNLDANVFWGLLNISTVLIGNSSAGIIEAPLFYLPVVNIGRRQEGRLRSNNIIDVTHDRVDIEDAINFAISDKKFISSIRKTKGPYGDGTAGKRIVELIKEVTIDKKLLVKNINY